VVIWSAQEVELGESLRQSLVGKGKLIFPTLSKDSKLEEVVLICVNQIIELCFCVSFSIDSICYGIRDIPDVIEKLG